MCRESLALFMLQNRKRIERPKRLANERKRVSRQEEEKAKPPKMVTPTRCADKAENITLAVPTNGRSRETRFEEEKREKHTIRMICGGQKDFVLIPL